MFKGRKGNLLQLMTMLFICLLFSTEVKGEDWVFFARYGDSFFYDRENINTPYENLKDVIGVWQKVIYDEESVKRIAAHLGVKYADLAESISMIEIDCYKKYVQTKAITYYDSNGKTIESSHKIRSDWKLIHPNTPYEYLYKKVCLKKKNIQ